MKGLLRMVVLVELSLKPHSGKTLRDALEPKLGKKPSPGSIYPLLDDLSNEGLVQMELSGKQKIYSLTKEGLSQSKECMAEKQKGIKEALEMMSILDPDNADKIMSLKDVLNNVEMDLEVVTEIMTAKMNILELFAKPNYSDVKKKVLKSLKSANKKLEALKND